VEHKLPAVWLRQLSRQENIYLVASASSVCSTVFLAIFQLQAGIGHGSITKLKNIIIHELVSKNHSKKKKVSA
jgi:hypothetical protein